MSERTIKTRLKLMRDNDYNYEKIKNTFVPLMGEVVLVDTASDGLRAKVGDGVSTYGELDFSDSTVRGLINSIVVRGYYFNGKFYEDSSHQVAIVGYIHKLYIDINKSAVYSFNGESYEFVGGAFPTASSTVAGIAKLYDETGNNTDGAMTQRATTAELNRRAIVSASASDEMLVIS